MFRREVVGSSRKGDTSYRPSTNVAHVRKPNEPTLLADYRSAVVFVTRKFWPGHIHFTTADLVFELYDRRLPIYPEMVEKVLAGAVRSGLCRRVARDTYRTNRFRGAA